MRVQVYTPHQGAYRIAATTGLLTGVAAATASAGHIFAARWPGGAGVAPQKHPNLAVVTRIRARWFTITGFTGAQEVGMDALIARAYTAAHTAGTAIDVSGNTGKKRTSYGSSLFGAANIQVGTTGALTNGTETLDGQPFAQGSFAELAAAATVPKGLFELNYLADGKDDHGIILAPNEGIVIRNSILMGAAGTARVVIEMDWLEVDSY